MEIRTYHLFFTDKEKVKFDRKVLGYCGLPYPGHKKGCPNFGKGKLCPPNTEFGESLMSEYSRYYLFIAEGNFQKYLQEMRAIHLDWTDAQLRNLLYWQSQLDKSLASEITSFVARQTWYHVFGFGAGIKVAGRTWPSMEACGIDVFETCENFHIPLERHPTSAVRKVALVLTRREQKYAKLF